MKIKLGNTIKTILQTHIDLMSHDIDSLIRGEVPFNIPFFPEDSLIELAYASRSLFSKEPTLLNLEPPIVIIGDLHGHILDLYRILTYYDLPPRTKYLFLGDIVDRGSFSLETLCLVYALKLSYPKSIYIIRGNHEFRDVTMTGGFLSEIISLYNNSHVLFDAFCDSFTYLPIACKIGPIFCVHGGISPDFSSLSQIDNIKRPIENSSTQLLCGIFWSDPSADAISFTTSRRGTGFYFGEEPTEKFLNNNNLTVLIRGHECVDGAMSIFNGKVVTIFSASSYCGLQSNKSGTIYITSSNSIQPHLFDPIPFVKRSFMNIIALPNNITLQKIRFSKSTVFPYVAKRKSLLINQKLQSKKRSHQSNYIPKVLGSYDSFYL